MRYMNKPTVPEMRMKNIVEKLTEKTENPAIQRITAERITIFKGVFFICFNIFNPAERISQITQT